MITENQRQINFCDAVTAPRLDPDGLDESIQQSPIIEDRALLQWIWFLVLVSYLARLDIGDDVAEDVADNRAQQ
jgi:hypothetical protein